MISLVVMLAAGCTIRMPGNSTTVTNDAANGNACLDIVERSLKARRSENNNYRFREELRYATDSKECTEKELSVRKTICVDRDCKTSKKYKMNTKSNKLKMSFMVNERKMDEKFTIITDILLKDSKIRTYGYEFYPRNCVDVACKE